MRAPQGATLEHVENLDLENSATQTSQGILTHVISRVDICKAGTGGQSLFPQWHHTAGLSALL